VGPVVINQIMYHPPDFGTNSPAHEEFVQLLNRSGEVVPLFDPSHPTNVWRLAGGVRFSFATNQTVPAGARLRVVGFDPSNLTLLNAFTSRYGANEPIVGPFSGSLDNAGDTIELWRPDFPQTTPIDFGFVPQLLVERVTYSETAPWPTSADGGGYLLERTDPASYGNDPANWHAALPEGAIGPIDPPAITTSLPGGDLVRLTFNVESGRSYQVEYKDALTDSEWSPLGSSIGATGTTLTVDDSIAGHACRFYRVVRLP
jgi:hypothetical protein